MCNLDSQKSLADSGCFWSRSAIPDENDADLHDHVATTAVIMAGDDHADDDADDGGDVALDDYSGFAAMILIMTMLMIQAASQAALNN